MKRLIQRITGFHRIHHVFHGFGYKIPLTKWGYFPHLGKKFQNIQGTMIGENGWFVKKYHDCTLTGRY